MSGEFWAIPLSDGTYACGVVVMAPLRERSASRVMFLAGLLDWWSPRAPTHDAIAAAPCLAQAKLHVEGIGFYGGNVLGVLGPGSVPILPWLFRGARMPENSHVYLGLSPQREQRPSDDELPVISTWGYDFARLVAERNFGVNPAKS